MMDKTLGQMVRESMASSRETFERLNGVLARQQQQAVEDYAAWLVDELERMAEWITVRPLPVP